MVNQNFQPNRYEVKASQLKQGMSEPVLPGGVVWVGNHRFKGYTSDFMETPRKPITMRELLDYGRPAPQPVPQPPQQPLAQPQMYTVPGRTVISPAPAPMQKFTVPPHHNSAPLPVLHKEYTTLPHPQNSIISPRQPMTVSAELHQRKVSADREIARFKQEKLARMMEEQNTIKQEFEQMRLYQPFGKAGAGAPIYPDDHRKQKVLNVQDGYLGAQIESKDPQRTEKNPYFKMNQKGDSAVERAIGDTQTRIEKLQGEMNHMMNSNPYVGSTAAPFGNRELTGPSGEFDFYDPWGKGQGNPRRRNNDGDVERFRQIKQRGIVPSANVSRSWAGPQTQAKPAMEAAMGGNNSVGTGLNTESRYGGAGEAVKTNSGHRRTRFPITMRKDIYGNPTMTEMDGFNPFKNKGPNDITYDPFGKPGNGAPIVREGRMNATRTNIDFAHETDTSADVHRRKKAADEYLHELKREMEEQRRNREEANVEARAPIGELATVFRQGKVGFPKRDPETGVLLNQHHVSSDITKSKVGIRENPKHAGVVGSDDYTVNSRQAKEYHNELSKLAEERHRVRQLERVRDTQEELLHGEKWNDMWGRPGGGAPNRKDLPEFRLPKFETVLHNPEHRNGLMFVKNTPAGIQNLSPRSYQKTTIPSSHTNMFEMPAAVIKKPTTTKNEYRPTAPFATIG